ATVDPPIKDQVIDVSITQNAPGAQYYNVYLNPNGCDGNPNNFSFINRFDAPGFSGGNPVGGYPNGGAGAVLSGGTGGWPCAAAGTGDANAPCANAKITPGAVQFYFTAGSCMSQNAQGATYVFSGEQYNWIVIYEAAGVPVTCNNTLDGGAGTQYIGTIYTPAAYWKITGGDRAPLAGQVIAWSATVAGGAQVGVDFNPNRSEEHTSELQSRGHLVCRLLLEKK